MNKFTASGFSWPQAKALSEAFEGQKPARRKKAEAVADSEATTIAALRDDFNGLLANLRKAGVLSE